MDEKLNSFPDSDLSQFERSVTTVEASDKEGSDHEAKENYPRPELDITQYYLTQA